MIRVLIVDRSIFICDSLRTILDKEDDFDVIGHVSDVDELRFLLAQTDVALISATFKGSETTDLIWNMRREHEHVKFIVLGISDEPARIVQFIEAGAAGYILQNERIDELVLKLRMVVNDQALISDRVASFLMKRISTLSKRQQGEERKELVTLLTPRQRDVIELLSEGLSSKEIAGRLHIEYGTVKNHVHHILKKIDATNRHEAASIYQAFQTRRVGAQRNNVGF